MSVQRASGLRLGEALVEQDFVGWDRVEKAVELQRRLRDAAGLNPTTYRAD